MSITFNVSQWLTFDESANHMQIGALLLIKLTDGQYKCGVLEGVGDGVQGPRVFLNEGHLLFRDQIDSIAIVPTPESQPIEIDVTVFNRN